MQFSHYIGRWMLELQIPMSLNSPDLYYFFSDLVSSQIPEYQNVPLWPIDHDDHLVRHSERNNIKRVILYFHLIVLHFL